MIISELAKQVSNEHLFYLIAKAARYGYHIHEEFIEEFDRRAEQHTVKPVYENTISLDDFYDKRLEIDFNVHGTVTGRFPSRPNIDSSLGIKLDC